ncbi:MAG: bifunctional 4-hydroxy-2-oxoglutarate aldolase/2-dehydro-3-deoxy-phosphogluconate aldolase [Clostridiales bacterium]|nr:bifunctional 4-hydroxy-2-oxoglutarate aldolase/2-dehydro-3-deoxy-phosphogluconate aldolase [Clostridiales bacterium]
MTEFYEKLRKTGIVPVIKINREEDAFPLAQALSQGDILAAEITFRSSAAAGAIGEICTHMPQMCVCAGTVLSVEMAKEAVDAGAEAIISPGTNMKVIDWCLDHEVPVIPGCATPTEVEACMERGLQVVKLFPAEVVGGVKMLKALAGPYSQMKFMPTGGISEANAGEYLSQPNVIACGGSWMVAEKLIDAGAYEEITRLAKQASEIVTQIRK